MKILVEDKDSYKHVKVQEWRLDLFSVSKLKEELLKIVPLSRGKNIVLDISSCSYCDTSGLSAMNMMHQMCEDSMGTFIVTGIQANIKKLFKICKLHKVWTIAEDLDEVEDIVKSRRGHRDNCA